MTKKLTQIVIYAFSSILLMLAALVAYTQTGMFRSNVRSVVYNVLENNINGSIYIGEIEGNIFNGFSIDTLMLYVDNEPVFLSGKVKVHYRAISLLKTKINIDSLVIEHPKVFLTRGKNGIWNVDKISKSTAPKDSIPSPWMFVARRITLSNATFSLVDSTGRYDSSNYVEDRKTINYSNIFLTNINLSALVIYSSEKLEASISNISFISPRENFSLKHLSLNCLYTSDSARVNNLELETPQTRITLSSRISGVDVFSVKDISEFENANIVTTIERSNIASEDLQAFLPELYFFKGQIGLTTILQGTFQQINVKKLDASFAKTELHLRGTVSNLHHPKELRLNIESQQSTVNPPDVPQVMPYFGIPLFSRIGPFALDFQFVGKPLDFMAISTLKSSAGDITVDGQLLITENDLHYKGMVSGKNVDLEKILDNPKLASQLNVKTFIEGKGTSIDRLNTEARLEIDSSLFYGIPVSSATLEAKAANRKINTDFSINSSAGRIQTAALFDFNNDRPLYTITARVRDLNLAPVFHDEYYASRLLFDIHHTTQSFTLFDGSSNSSIQFLPSTFHGYSIDSSKSELHVHTDALGTKHVSFASPIADGEFQGVFTFNGFLNTLQSGIEQFKKIYQYQRQVLDTTFKNYAGNSSDTSSLAESNDIEYKIFTKNLRPLAVFFHTPIFDLQSTLAGTLKKVRQETSFNGDLLLQRGIFIQDSTIVQFSGTKIQFSLEDIPSLKLHHRLPMKVEMKLDGDEVAVNRTSFHYPKCNVSFNGMQGDYILYSDIDTSISIAVEGMFDVHAREERFLFTKLRAKYQGYEIENSRNFSASLSHRMIIIDSARFVRRDQTAMVHGSFNFDGAIDAVALVSNFAASDLYYFGDSPSFRENALAFGGSFDASLQLTGTVKNPVYTAKLTGKELTYQNTYLGRLVGVAEYKNSHAALNVEISSTNDSLQSSNVFLKGIIPINLSLIAVEKRTAIEGLDVRLRTNDLKMSALDPFIPEIRNVLGNLNGDILITGSLDKPILNGTVSLDSGYFQLEINSIPYLAEGKIGIKNNRAMLDNFVVTNLSQDYYTGKMNVGGDIALDHFAPREYHLKAAGELLVLQERSKTPASSFFGTLVISTGSDSIRFDGTYERSLISGTMYIQQGSLIFPPTQQASMYSSSGFGKVEFIDDTTMIIPDSSLVDFVEKIFPTQKVIERSFADGVGYDLTIITQGNVRVNMIFNANVGAYEELFAELNGKMTLKKDESETRFIGTINVGSGSTYEFYKKFNATGSLTFVGDPQNPQLKILAEYEGVHVKDPLKTNEEERVIVSLDITGTRLHPSVKIGLSTFDQSGKETVRTGEVENDAISFLLTSSPGTPGKFRDELTTQDRNRIGEQVYSTIGGTFINSMLSGAVMDFISKNNIPYVKRVEVSDVGADPNINVRVEVFETVISAGGRIFSNINNTNISIQRPVLGKSNRNFMMEVEKKTENFSYSLESRTILSARLFYRFTF